MVEVAGEVARRLHIDGEEDAAISERLASAAQDEVRCGLVLDGVEGGDEIEARGGWPVAPCIVYLPDRWEEGHLLPICGSQAVW